MSRTKEKTAPTLRTGERYRKNGTYEYRWQGNDGKRHSVYAPTLDKLRETESEIAKNTSDGIKSESRCVSLNDMYNQWTELKRGLRDNTLQNYRYMYTQFVAPNFGTKRLAQIVKSDIKRFYNTLIDERGLSVSTVDSIHTVIHQVLNMAVDDNYIRKNPSDNVLREVKLAYDKSQKRKALTLPQQNLFIEFLRNDETYRHWYPIFAVMLGTGMRVGEVTGLRWCDIDLENGLIDVNHTLVLYNHETNGVYFNVHSPKTSNSVRKIPMLDSVKEAFFAEKEYQESKGLHCKSVIDGYANFIFTNRFGNVQHEGTLNKALRRIIRDCNDRILTKDEHATLLLPYFSCHNLRHTFATRMCEAGVNIKVIQDTLGHSDVKTTLNIYTDATEELKQSEFQNLNSF